VVFGGRIGHLRKRLISSQTCIPEKEVAVRDLSERFIVRIGRDDLAQAKAAGKGLGMNLSAFTRMSLKERADLEAAIRRQDGGSNNGGS
jgi:hypothetical protein